VNIGKQAYLKAVREENALVHQHITKDLAGTTINKYARRWLARNRLKKMKARRNAARCIQRGFRSHAAWRKEQEAQAMERAVIRIQKTFRMHYWHSYYQNVYKSHLQRQRAERILSDRLMALFYGWRVRKQMKKFKMEQKAYSDEGHWDEVLREAGQAVRSFAVYDEYIHPHDQRLKFYHNRVANTFTMEQPEAWVQKDLADFEVNLLGSVLNHS